nr:reverse transcriptase domain-containing protein [Tanacetum cinerariifolium]
GSFDVIIGMDWLSGHKAEIICHQKVVRIPLLDGKVLREIKFWIELIPNAMPVAKSPYYLAPSKLEELLRQLKDSMTKIMLPTMTTRSAGLPTAASRGRGTGGRASSGGGRTRGRSGS